MMMKSNQLIYKTSDDFGPIEVYENQLLRSLHFGTRARQSAMYLDKPYLLPLSYSRYMLAPLLFREKLSRVLILGLGAGSLYQYFDYHFGTALQIDAVELRSEVVEVAKQYFYLSEKQADRIHVQSAYDFMEALTQQYDVVLVDIYNDRGVDDTILRADFFDLLRRAVPEDGFLSVNLWSSHPDVFHKVQALISERFSHRLNIPVPNKGNIIILASDRDRDIHNPRWMTAAAELQTRLNVEFGILLNQIRNYNKVK